MTAERTVAGNVRAAGSAATGVSAERPPRPASSRLAAEARRLEAALDRYRAWYKKRLAEEHALIAQLQSHRAKTAEGVKKADELSATLAGIRLQLVEETEKESTL